MVLIINHLVIHTQKKPTKNIRRLFNALKNKNYIANFFCRLASNAFKKSSVFK